MKQINKTPFKLPSKYQKWLESNPADNKNFRDFYDDIVMNLYRCQNGVCAYTESFICPTELFSENNWSTGEYIITDESEFSRVDHRGELEHFDAQNKNVQYWNWDNLFMIDSKINSIKTNKLVNDFLKPDLPDYNPELYFEYDDQTHRFIANTEIEDDELIAKIRYMIDEVLCLNHGVVKVDRKNYINELKDKKMRGQHFVIDRFFTSVKWVLEDD